jgi:periplasmic protein TonB
MKYIVLIACVVIAQGSFAQKAQDTATSRKVYTFVEEMPKAPYDFDAYVAKNLRYPEKAKNEQIEGRVSVRFIVEENGKITDVKAVRGIGFGCDEEAVRVIAGMPDWKPGRQGGKPVAVPFTIPVVFRNKSDK